jgi:hypothetical protein
LAVSRVEQTGGRPRLITTATKAIKATKGGL